MGTLNKNEPTVLSKMLKLNIYDSKIFKTYNSKINEIIYSVIYSLQSLQQLLLLVTCFDKLKDKER